MGILATRFAELRSVRNWLADDDDDHGNTSAGVRVTAKSALTLSTVFRIYDLLASSVAMAPKDVILKINGLSYPQFNKPAWLRRPNPQNPNYTERAYFMQVALSTLFDGNYFVHCAPYVYDAQAVTVLPPGRVTVKEEAGAPVYELYDAAGRLINRLGPMEVLHGSWMVPPGENRGIAPLEMLRRGVGGAIAAEDYGARFFGQGASLSFGVEVPGPLTKEQRDDLAASMRKKYAGLQNSHAIGVLTNGGKFVPGLAPTPEQAQMLETRKFYVEDLARAFGIPPGLLGSQEPGASSYASAYVYDAQFKERAVLPLAERIEDLHDRLVEMLPETLTIPNASAQFRINLDHIARVDIKTRAEAAQIKINSGQQTPNEARRLEDLPPVEGGDQLFMQEQMTPINKLGQTPAAPAARSDEVAP